MAGNVYMIPVSGFILVEARSSEDAGMAASAKFSDCPEIQFYMGAAMHSDQAKELGVLDSYAIDHCGMTVGEFLEEQETDF